MPLANLWIPFQRLSEFHAAADPACVASRLPPPPRTDAPVGAWWATWVVSGVSLQRLVFGEAHRSVVPRAATWHLVSFARLGVVPARRCRHLRRRALRNGMRLRAMHDDPDPIAAMSALPHLADMPPWATTDADAAIARWTAAYVGDERRAAARAARAAVLAVLDRLPPDAEDTVVTRDWVDAQLAAVSAWIADPSASHQELARASMDPTRQTFAWSDFDFVDGWIAEASDFAVHAVWSGALEGYVKPPSPRVCAALAAVCAARALTCEGVDASVAVARIARTIVHGLGAD